MRLERMSWKDCEEYFKDHDMVILTTGSTENHGIHNPLGTDIMIPNKILELIEKQSDVLIFLCFSLFLGWFLVILVLVFVIWVCGGAEGDFAGI